MIKNEEFKRLAREIYEKMSRMDYEYSKLDDDDFRCSCDKYPFEKSFDEVVCEFGLWVDEMENGKSFIERINENKNIAVNNKQDRFLYLQFQPYDKEINVKYLKQWIEYIKENENDLKEKYNKDTIVINVSNGFNVDGLTETNTDLIHFGSAVCDNYTDECLEIDIL